MNCRILQDEFVNRLTSLRSTSQFKEVLPSTAHSCSKSRPRTTGKRFASIIAPKTCSTTWWQIATRFSIEETREVTGFVSMSWRSTRLISAYSSYVCISEFGGRVHDSFWRRFPRKAIHFYFFASQSLDLLPSHKVSNFVICFKIYFRSIAIRAPQIRAVV